MVKVTKEHVSDCKRLLELMGIPYVEAESEAEAQCAQMAEGKVQSLHSIFFSWNTYDSYESYDMIEHL